MVNFEFSKTAVLIIVILCLIFFNQIIFSPNSIFNASDIITYFYPNFIFTKIAFQWGVPLWNPLVFAGHPWVGNPQSDIFYPFSMLNLVLPSHLAINYSIILQIMLTGIVLYFYLREINIDSGFSLFGALAFIFSGHIIARIYAGHLSIINSLPWIPLAFLLVERFVMTRKFYLILIIGVVLGLQFLGAHPQNFVFTILVIFLYLSFRIISETKNAIYLIKILFIIGLVTFGISAIKLFPVYEFTKLSVRSSGLSYEELTSISLPPIQLITLFMPEFFGTQIDYTRWGARNFWELTGYIGILPIMFSLLAIYLRRSKLVLFFTALSFFSIIYALGAYTPLFNLILQIPLLNYFRVPARFLLFFTFSVSILSSIGLQTSFENFKKILWLKKPLALVCIFCVLAILSSFVLREDILIFAKTLAEQRLEEEAKEDPISFAVTNLLKTKGIEYFIENILNHIIANIFVIAISLGGFYLAYVLLERHLISKNYFIILIISLLIFDLWSFGAKYISIKEVSYANLLNVPDETYEYRLLTPPENSFYDNIELNRRFIQRFDGYDSGMLAYYTDVFKLKDNKAIQEIANVKFIYNGVYPDGYLIALNETLPRAFVVHGNVSTSVKNHLDLMSKPDFDPRKIALIGNNVIEIEDIELVDFVSYTPNKVELQVNSNKKGHLILLDTWYPQWTAYVNGETTDVIPAYHMMRAIEIPSGKSQVVFQFDTDLFNLGAFISVVSISAVFIVLLLKTNNLDFKLLKSKSKSKP